MPTIFKKASLIVMFFAKISPVLGIFNIPFSGKPSYALAILLIKVLDVPSNFVAVTGAECNTVIELKLEHHAA
ncbi:hypothetical protein [Pseudomonas lactis]|uniref:hypothetical protein n=1 Tax=Pseudomonas lactis TaxID=1615674 RepID=UPI00110CA4D3|nr:hypothetical protein [Pseudomonas lactis]